MSTEAATSAHPALVSASVSLSFIPTDEAFADAIRHPARHPELLGHLVAFVSDVPAALIWSFAERWNLDDEILLRLCDAVDASCGPHSERLRRLLAGR